MTQQKRIVSSPSVRNYYAQAALLAQTAPLRRKIWIILSNIFYSIPAFIASWAYKVVAEQKEAQLWSEMIKHSRQTRRANQCIVRLSRGAKYKKIKKLAKEYPDLINLKAIQSNLRYD